MLALKIAALVGLAFLMSGCTQSAQMCSFEKALHNSFTALAAEGEFSAATVTNVNAVHAGATAMCANPSASTPEEVLAAATAAYIVMKRAMGESTRATVVLYPQVRDLERMLKEAQK